MYSCTCCVYVAQLDFGSIVPFVRSRELLLGGGPLSLRHAVFLMPLLYDTPVEKCVCAVC